MDTLQQFGFDWSGSFEMFENNGHICMYIASEQGQNYIMNTITPAPLSISIFSGSELITSNFSIILMKCPCRKIILAQIRMPKNS